MCGEFWAKMERTARGPARHAQFSCSTPILSHLISPLPCLSLFHLYHLVFNFFESLCTCSSVDDAHKGRCRRILCKRSSAPSVRRCRYCRSRHTCLCRWCCRGLRCRSLCTCPAAGARICCREAVSACFSQRAGASSFLAAEGCGVATVASPNALPAAGFTPCSLCLRCFPCGPSGCVLLQHSWVAYCSRLQTISVV